MLGLPKNTELKKQLPKSSIYKKFAMDTVAREKFDNDISRIFIVNEISSQTTTLAKGENIDCFYVLLISLKHRDFNEKNIALISKLINQNMLFILEYEQEAKLAVYHTKLHQTNWEKSENLVGNIFMRSNILKGLDFDSVWKNIIISIGQIQLEEGKSLDEQIEVDNQRKKNKNHINALEKKAKSEKQPKIKFEIVQEIKRFKESLE